MKTSLKAPLVVCVSWLAICGCHSGEPGSPASVDPAPVTRPPGDGEAYAPADVGRCEIKRLPKCRILESKAAGEATKEETMNRAFMPLFRYINDNDIPMTTPVEMRSAGGAAMAFHLDTKSAARDDLAGTGAVTLRELPERDVAALAARGSYTRERYENTLKALNEWLAKHPEYEAAGEPYAVFWNSPFVPGFMKKSEVHVPVKKRSR